MAESKFTPGPWVARKVIAPHREFWIIRADDQVVASTGDVENFGYEQEANAELMADAPRLLEVLRDLFDSTIGDPMEDRHVVKKAYLDAERLLEKHGG
jgi:hypothetical protein